MAEILDISVMAWLSNVLGLVMIVSILIAAFADIATRTIPNSIAAIVAVAGLIARILVGPKALAISAGVSVAVFVFLVLLHARGFLGGGDVKLIAAVTLGFSLQSTIDFVCITALAGGLLAIFHLIARRVLRDRPPSAPPPRGSSLPGRVFAAERWRIARRGPLPYGVAIACGGIWVIISQARS